MFCHVNDAVLGLVALLKNPKSVGEVFNIGGVGEIYIAALAEKIIRMTKSNSKIVKIPYTSAYPNGYEDMQRRVPNISKLELFTGWTPKLDLEKAILDIINER